MKKLLFIIIAIFFAQSVLNAQCNPDLNYTDPGFYPDTIINIPPAVVGEAYSTVINAVIPTEVELQGYTLAVDSVRVFSILNLPSNLSFTANTNSGFWLANTNGCFTIEGLPAIESIGLNELEIVLDYRVSFLGMAYEVPDTLKGYKLIVSNEPISAVTKYGQESSTSDNFVGENGKVTNTPLISSSGKIFQLPDVQTIYVDNITTNSAIFNGNIIDNGGLNITQSGFCWNTVSNPTIADQIHIGYDQEGEYSANITGFDYNTEYFVKAYAKNAKGVSYGDEVSFMTLTATLPEVITNEVTSVTSTTATSGGNVISDGGSTVTERGVCWSTNPNPTVSDSHTTNGSGVGNFTSNASNLNDGTTYHIRAYAVNNIGTAFGSEFIFVTDIITLPEVMTYQATNIGGNTANAGGEILDTGGGVISAEGLCWSTNPTPTISDNNNNSFADPIVGLIPNTVYYFRAYATNTAGTSYGEEYSFNSGQILGDFFNGGIVFYNDGNGHGLLCATEDQGQTNWGNALTICQELELNGFDDWYLPSKNNLQMMCVILHDNLNIGNFISSYYWSSTQYFPPGSSVSTASWRCNFNYYGYLASSSVSNSYYVRAIRAF